MKTLLLSFIFLSFIISNSFASSNPWVKSELAVDLIVELPEVQFEMDEFELTASSLASLEVLKEFLMANESVKLEVRGHTNSIPPAAYCDELSSNRAQAVKDYLVKGGISPERLEAKGYGKNVPRSSNLTAFDRKSNQRVDVKVIAL